MAESAFDRDVDPQQQIRQMLGVIRRGWLAIATCLGAGVLVGIALWFFIPKTYVSTGKMLMRSAWMFEAFGDARSMDELPFSARARQLEDELRSTAWVEAVLDKLEWPDWARAKNRGELERRRFVQKVKEKITCRVTPGETGERLVFVSFGWSDRALSAEFCRALIEYWTDNAVSGYTGEIDRRLGISEENLRLKQGELEEARRALEQFEIRHGISAINQRQDSQQRHDQLAMQLDTISGEIADLEARAETINQALAAVDVTGALLIPPTLPESSTISNDEKAAALSHAMQVVQEIAALELKGYTDRYPPLQQLRAELKTLLIKTSELPNTVAVQNKPLPNPAWVDKKAQYDALYVDLQGRKASKMKLEASVKEIEETLQTLPEVLRQHETFREAVAIRQQIVIEQQLDLQPLRDKKQAVSRKGPGQMRPYEELEKPVPAPSPSSAIGWLALAVSTMIGLGLALLVVIGKELLRSSFASADQARKALKLPVLGEVAPIQTVLEVRRSRFVRALQIAASLTLLVGIGAGIYVCVAYPKDLPRGLVEWAQDLREALS